MEFTGVESFAVEFTEVEFTGQQQTYFFLSHLNAKPCHEFNVPSPESSHFHGCRIGI